MKKVLLCLFIFISLKSNSQTIYNTSGQAICTIQNGAFYSRGNRVGFIQQGVIYNGRGNTLGSIQSNSIFNTSGQAVCTIQNSAFYSGGRAIGILQQNALYSSGKIVFQYQGYLSEIELAVYYLYFFN